MTAASVKALQTIRDFSMLQWYVIPLFAFVLYVYAVEIRKARAGGNWDPVLAGLILFGMDFFNETWNGWTLAITGRSAFWTTPGDTALRTLVGWNIEIMLMFAVAGIVFYYVCPADRKERILRLPARWFWAIAFTVFCVLVEVVLNIGGLLVWEYSFWNRSITGIWLILVFGYFEFFAAINLVLGIQGTAVPARKRGPARRRPGRWSLLTFTGLQRKLAVVSIIYAVPILMNIFGFAVMRWIY